MPESALRSYRSGWDNANTRFCNPSVARRMLTEGREDVSSLLGGCSSTWEPIQEYGIEFDEGRTAPWKKGCIKADITLGVQDL